MRRNDSITVINSNHKNKKEQIAIKHSNRNIVNVTVPRLQPTPINSSRSSLLSQRSRPQTAKIDRKSLTYNGCIQPNRIKKPIEIDEFMKSARRVDYNCQSLSTLVTPIIDLAQNEDPNFVSEYIDKYVRGLMSNDAALLIQSNFRLYIEKKNWKGVIHHRIWNRLDALRRIFVGWHGYVSKDITVITKCYDKFAALFKEKPWLSRKQTLSPFRLFYLNGRWFYPKNHDPRDIYIITRLFEHSNARRFLHLWKSISHSIRELRPVTNKFRFTNSKLRHFGRIFNIFHVWHRYTKWKKLSKNTEKQFYLNCVEIILPWNIIERKLNDRKMQVLRAGRCSIKRIKKKAYNAIYQRYVDHLRALSEFESSYKFYLNHLQRRARSAWSSYMTIQHANRVEMKKIMKSWYAISFQSAKIKNLLAHFTEYIRIRHFSMFFNAWRQTAHELKLKSIRNSLKLQEKPSIPYYALFKMMNHFEFHFFIKVWKEWLEITRRRKFWKIFASNYSNYDYDYELKQKVFYNFIYRQYYNINHQSKFYPNKTPYSFFGMVQKIKKIKKFMREPSANDNDNDDLQWKFLTQNNKENCLDIMNEDLLTRSFVLFISKHSQSSTSSRIHDYKNDQNRMLSGREIISNEEEEQNQIKLFSFNELVDILRSNRKLIRMKLINKINHDSNIFNASCSHFSAIKFHLTDQNFTLVDDITVIQSLNPNENPFKVQALNFSPEIYSSIEKLIDINSKPREISPIYKIRLVQKIHNFKSHFRFPSNLLQTQIYLRSESSEKFLSTSSAGSMASAEESQIQVTKQPSTAKIFLISSYKTPVVDEKPFPIENPLLNEIKQLKELSQNSSSASSQIAKASKDSQLKSFGILSYRDKVMHMTLDDMLNGLRRFFLNMNDIRIDISRPLIYSKDDKNSLNLIPVESRHQIRRRINGFIAEMCGFDTSQNAPLFVDADQFVYDCVSAVFTAYTEVMKFKETAKFCDSIPFPDFIHMDDTTMLNLRSSILSKIFEKFPYLAKEAMVKMNSIKIGDKIVPLSPKNIGSHDIMLLDDAYISVLLLPLILKPELIKNFLHDKQYEKALKAKKENPNLTSHSTLK